MASYHDSERYEGLGLPQGGVPFPAGEELVQLYTLPEVPIAHIPQPAGTPVYWIKHGDGVYWGEVASQTVEHHELRRLDSALPAPAVYRAHRVRTADGQISMSVIVVEYIPGKTAGRRVGEGLDSMKVVCRHLAYVIKELNRIPVP